MKRHVLWECIIGDVSDPDTYASGLVLGWEHSDAGEWAKQHVQDGKLWYITEFKNTDHIQFLVQVFGEMSDKDYTYFSLKWGTNP